MRVCDISKEEGVEDRVVILNVPLDFHGDVVLRPRSYAGEPEQVDKVTALEAAVEIHDLEVSADVMKAFEAKDWARLTELTPRAERVKSVSNSRRSEGAKKAAVTRARRKREAEDAARAAGEAARAASDAEIAAARTAATEAQHHDAGDV